MDRSMGQQSIRVWADAFQPPEVRSECYKHFMGYLLSCLERQGLYEGGIDLDDWTYFLGEQVEENGKCAFQILIYLKDSMTNDVLENMIAYLKHFSGGINIETYVGEDTPIQEINANPILYNTHLYNPRARTTIVYGKPLHYFSIGFW